LRVREFTASDNNFVVARQCRAVELHLVVPRCNAMRVGSVQRAGLSPQRGIIAKDWFRAAAT